MKRSIFLIVVLIFLITSVAITGCAQPAPSTVPEAAKPEPKADTGPAADQVIELKFSYWPPPVDPWVQRGIIDWGPELEKKTDGKVKVTYYGGATLGAPPDHLSLVMQGTCDIGWICPGFTPGVFPLTDIRNMPFIYPTVEVANKVAWRQQEFLNDLEYKDKVHVLWTFICPLMECSTRVKQVKTLEDLKGLKFADTEPIGALATEAMGAVPVVFHDETEVFTGLERGMLDGRWQEYNGLKTWRCDQVTKYRTDNIRIYSHQNAIIMNLDVYNNLPDDIRKAIDEISGFDRSAKSGDVWALCEKESREAVLEYDKKVGNPPPYILPDAERERWVKTAQVVVENWLKDMDSKGMGPQAKDLYAKTLEWVDEYSE